MLFQLSTRKIPASDRADYWRTALRLALKSECKVTPLGEGPLDASVGVMPCGPLGLVELSGTGYRLSRSGPGDPGLVSLVFQVEGVATISDSRRSAQLTPGDMCVVPHDRDAVGERPGSFQQIVIQAPIEHVDEALPRWRELTAVTVDGDRPGVRPALDLARFVLAYHSTLDAGNRERLGTTLLNLLAGGLGDACSTVPKASGTRTSRLATFHRQRINRYIDEHLRDPDLSVAMIAKDLGLSTRYVHKLFENEPAHVMQQAMARRLRECQRDIGTRGTRSISEIAYSWGFNSPAHFSRAFKKHFGACPSDALPAPMRQIAEAVA
jgi:AraC-like DNA-binding protein